MAMSLPSPAKETKHETFRRLAERRTNAVIERLRVLGNLSNPHAYEYTDDDVRAIFSAIEREVRLTKLKFQDRQKKEFRLT